MCFSSRGSSKTRLYNSLSLGLPDTNTKSEEGVDTKPLAEGESFANLKDNKDYAKTNLWINLLGGAAQAEVQNHVNTFARNTFS